MSFGIGVGDVVQVLDLSFKLSKSLNVLQYDPRYAATFSNAGVHEFAKVIAEQRLVVENLLSTLLEDLLGSPDAVRKLREAPGAFNWQDPALESKLKTYLGEYQDVFFQSLREIEKSLEALNQVTQKLERMNKQKWNRFKRFQWAPLKLEETEEQLQAVTRSVTKLEAIVQNVLISRSQLANLDIEKVLDKIGELEESTDDTGSVLSDDTDVRGRSFTARCIAANVRQNEEDEGFSSVLYVSLSAGDTPLREVQRTVKRDALLDTGVDRCCVSEDIASDLDAVLVPADDVELWTANRQRIFHKGKMKLRVGWEDNTGAGQRAKINFYVVQGFDLPLVLSNYFVTKHRLLEFARSVSSSFVSRVAPILFEFRDAAKRAADAEKLAEAVSENQNRDDQEREARLEELQRRMGLAPAVSRTETTTSTSQSLRSNTNTSDANSK